MYSNMVNYEEEEDANPLQLCFLHFLKLFWPLGVWVMKLEKIF